MNTAERRSRALTPILVTAALTLVVANIGGMLTDLGPWYQSLRQPDWKPGDEWFPVVWSVIFALAGAAAYLAWRGAPDAGGRRLVIAVFGLNGLLNIGWTALFFLVQRPDWALVETGFLWLSVVAMILVARRTSAIAPWLLVPYLLWVSIAAVLNWQVNVLNAPFG